MSKHTDISAAVMGVMLAHGVVFTALATKPVFKRTDSMVSSAAVGALRAATRAQRTYGVARALSPGEISLLQAQEALAPQLLSRTGAGCVWLQRRRYGAPVGKPFYSCTTLGREMVGDGLAGGLLGALGGALNPAFWGFWVVGGTAAGAVLGMLYYESSGYNNDAH
ncbi:MAG: hypothetical protein ACYDEV_14625 [Acidiferrobacter sp.]